LGSLLILKRKPVIAIACVDGEGLAFRDPANAGRREMFANDSDGRKLWVANDLTISILIDTHKFVRLFHNHGISLRLTGVW